MYFWVLKMFLRRSRSICTYFCRYIWGSCHLIPKSWLRYYTGRSLAKHYDVYILNIWGSCPPPPPPPYQKSWLRYWELTRFARSLNMIWNSMLITLDVIVIPLLFGGNRNLCPKYASETVFSGPKCKIFTALSRRGDTPSQTLAVLLEVPLTRIFDPPPRNISGHGPVTLWMRTFLWHYASRVVTLWVRNFLWHYASTVVTLWVRKVVTLCVGCDITS